MLRRASTADITNNQKVVNTGMDGWKGCGKTNACLRQQPVVAQSRRVTLWPLPGVRRPTRTRATGRPGCWSSVAWCSLRHRRWARGTLPVVAARLGGALG